ncbi:MAG: hypothetical protein IJJ47_12325 [Methanosphaera sp.]|nr:hypothetical protein [Methanosphaera sp.]
MSEFEELFGEEFFILDSENLNSIKTKLYGYMIIEKEEGYNIVRDNLDNPSDLTPDGTYVYINKTDDNIFIHQDFNGCYGLYIYKNDKYFCISNSFLKLVNYLKHKVKLSLNIKIAKSYLSSTLCTLSYKETLINEIKLIPRNKYIKIDIKKETIDFSPIDYEENTLDLDSPEAMEILDKWFYKWINLFRQIKLETDNLSFDLTGGYDSRLNFALLLSSKIDLNKIMIRSIDNDLHTHAADFEIASEIANYYDFKLNNQENIVKNPQYFQDIATSLNVSYYVKLGFHNQMHYQNAKNTNPTYRVTGAGGGMLRGYEAADDEFYSQRSQNISGELTNSVEEVFKDNFKEYVKEYDISEDEFPYVNYRETRRTNHFGKQSTVSYLTNNILLNPLIDSDIAKLKRSTEDWRDNDLLITLIFVRYCPKLLDFKFQDGKGIDINTVEYAKYLNESYPLKIKNLELISEKTSEDIEIQENKKYFNLNEINKYLKNIFLTKSFRNTFQTYFSPRIYDWAALKITTKKYFPLQYTYPIFSIVKMINDVTISNKNYDNEEIGWLNRHLEVPDYQDLDLKAKKYLLKYISARIDIQNYGKNNSIELLECSDLNAFIRTISWIPVSKGGGIVIRSDNSKITLLVKVMNSGKLKIVLRSRFSRDKNKIKFPIYIDYTKLTVNDKVIFDENKLLWHDKPYIHKQDVNDGEIIKIDIEWLPFNMNSDFSPYQ